MLSSEDVEAIRTALQRLDDEQLALIRAILADGPGLIDSRMEILRRISRMCRYGHGCSSWWWGWAEVPAGREAESLAETARLVSEEARRRGLRPGAGEEG